MQAIDSPEILADLGLGVSARMVERVSPLGRPSSASSATADAVIVVVPSSAAPGQGSAATDWRQADESVVVTLIAHKIRLMLTLPQNEIFLNEA